MAKLTYVYRTEDISYVTVRRRQLPVVAGDNLMMLMDLSSKGLCIDSPQIRGRELEEFTRKFNLLSQEELRQSLEIDSTTFLSVLNQCVQCVGCRRRVERLFCQLTLSGHPTLDPLVLTNSSILSIKEEKLKTPQALGSLLYRHHEVLNTLLENKLRNKTRCLLHSLDTFRSKPFSETWRDVWSWMKHNCRDELAVIDTKELREVLENYLKKHKFCQGCRTKIEKAYKILVGEITNTKEKGYVATLYANIKKCNLDEHIHVITNKVDFLDMLIRRAEPEITGSFSKHRERHAKTLEIAQEEVLTCVGMIMYERLRRIYVSLREEEHACQVLAAVGVHALYRSFDTSVEKKQGFSNLELLYQEISRAEKAKEHKREQKKLKKKKKKIEKKNNCRSCENIDDASSERAETDDDYDVDVDDEEQPEAAVDDMQQDDDDASGAVVEMETVADEFDAHTDNFASEEEPTQAGFTQVQKKKKQQKQKQKKKQKQKLNNVQQKKSSKEVTFSCNNNCGEKAIVQAAKAVMEPPSAAAVVRSDEVKCNDCHAPNMHCPCESDLRDSGYGSEPHSHSHSLVSSAISTPEGSVVSCSDGFCNHDHALAAHNLEEEHEHCEHELSYSLQQGDNTLSLQQMLDEFEVYDNDDVNCYIPQEVVLEYQVQHEKVQQQRQQLRETLRQNFARLCQSGLSNTLGCK